MKNVRTRYGFGATWVSNANEFFQEHTVLVMIPVTQDNSKVLVVGMNLFRRMEKERGA